ncbi:NAD(P)-dependent oxidoreductase [Streptomyces sp. NPDC094034]|uniref:NAD(P)-dependent oxidoreductase n=1 Tax=Streptomyces sp. NPDC094034 TaxID=3155309 RepID=UPI00331BE7F0
MSAPARVGFTGAGVMGLPMARRLLAAGHQVMVYARTPAKAQPLVEAGADRAATPARIARDCEVVIGCLLDEQAVRDVYLGENGLLSAARPGQLFVEHATIAPALARTLAGHAKRRGAGFLDVPVTGGPQRARDGLLTGIAGGDAAQLASVRPLLGVYCSQIVHVGAVGKGLELKLVNQLLVSVHVAAAAEAAALLSRLGLPPRESERVLMSGWGASAMLDYCLPAALTPSDAVSGATIGGLVPVQRLVADLAARSDVTLRVFTAACGPFNALARAGAGRRDLAQLARAYDPVPPAGSGPEPGPGAGPEPGPGAAAGPATTTGSGGTDGRAAGW